MLGMKRKKKTPYQYPESSKEVFVTQPMLFAVRDELKEEIRAVKFELKSDIAKLASRFETIDSRFEQIDARLFSLEASIAKLAAETHRFVCLVEEQNARNTAVIDGLTSLFNRQERVEKKLDGRF